MNTTSLRFALMFVLATTAAACGGDVTTGVPARGIPGEDVPAVTDDTPSTPDGSVAPDSAVTPDGSTPEDVVAPPDDTGWQPPPGTDTSCVSGTRWTRGNRGSASMNPGQACINCHRSMREGPQYLGGTVYYLANEVNNCNGYSGRAPGGPSGTAYVEITDGAGRMVRLTVNAAGNFSTNSAFTFPLRSARVVGPTGLTNEMSSPIPHGDCNACHTQMGTTTIAGGDPAPGRITVPL